MSAENAARTAKAAPAGWNPVKRELGYAYQKPETGKPASEQAPKSSKSAAEIVRKVLKAAGK